MMSGKGLDRWHRAWPSRRVWRWTLVLGVLASTGLAAAPVGPTPSDEHRIAAQTPRPASAVKITEWLRLLAPPADPASQPPEAQARRTAIVELASTDLSLSQREEVLHALERLVEDEEVQEAVLDALVRLGSPLPIAALRSSEDYSRRVRELAARSLGRAELADPQRQMAVDALIDVLDHRFLRAAASDAIVRIGLPAVPRLVQALGDSGRTGESRAVVVQILGVMDLPPESTEVTHALLAALVDPNYRVQDAARKAIVQKGVAGSTSHLVALLQTAQTELESLAGNRLVTENERADSLRYLGVVMALGELARHGRQAPDPDLLAGVRPNLERLVEHGVPGVRYCALQALDRLLRAADGKDAQLLGARIATLMKGREDPHTLTRTYARSMIEELGQELTPDDLRANVLVDPDPSVRMFAARTLRRRQVSEAVDDLAAALARETDPQAKVFLEEVHRDVSELASGPSAGRRVFWSVLIISIIFGGLLVGLVLSWWFNLRRQFAARLAANTKALRAPFGLNADDLKRPEYAEVVRQLPAFDLGPEGASEKPFEEILGCLRRRLGFTAEDLRTDYPDKVRLIERVLERLEDPTRIEEITSRRNPLDLRLASSSVFSVSPSELKALQIPSKVSFAIAVLSDELEEWYQSLQQALDYLVKTGRVEFADLQTMQADRKVPLVTTMLVPPDRFEEIMEVRRRIASIFPFLNEEGAALLAPQDQARFLIGCARQDSALQVFDEILQDTVLKTLRVGDVPRFAHVMNPHKEAEAELREMGTTDPEQHRSLEEQLARDDAQMIISLMEIAASSEDARNFFKSRIMSRLTDKDHEAFEGSGLKPKRIRELLVNAALATKRAMA